MGELHTQRATGKLEQLAEQKFGKASLTCAERQLLNVASNFLPETYWAQCGPSLFPDEGNDPSKAEKSCTNPGWGPEREIRAEVIRWLCVDEKAKHEVDPRGIRVYGAKITGRLDLRSVSIPFPIYLEHCRLMTDVDLRDAQLPLLSLDGCWVPPISADRLDVKGSVFLRYGFHGNSVGLRGAHIGGDLDCRGGTFVNAYGEALSANSIDVHGSVFFSGGFHAEGEVLLIDAQIGDSLNCAGGTFFKAPGTALMAHLKGKSLVEYLKGPALCAYLEEKPPSEYLTGADFGAYLKAPGNALSADRVNVRGGVLLRNHFRAFGDVRLPGAQIGGELDCSGSALAKLNAVSMTVKDDFWWGGLINTSGGVGVDVDLTNASVGSMRDDWDESRWPKRLLLDGFTYGRISWGPTDAETRLRWLARQDHFAPQPYRQLAKVLRERGDEDGAVTVLEKMECLRRKPEDLHRPDRQLLSWLFREFAGYGYAPGRSVLAIIALSGLGWIIYRRSYLAGGMVPAEKDARESFNYDGQPPPDYTPFAPLVYSVENSLPLVKLGQEDTWHPQPDRESALSRRGNWPTRLAAPRNWIRFQGLQRRLILWGLQRDPEPKGELPRLQRFLVFCGLQPHPDRESARSRPSRWFTSPRFVRWFLWIHILLGWLLATLFLAGVTGIVRKD